MFNVLYIGLYVPGWLPALEKDRLLQSVCCRHIRLTFNSVMVSIVFKLGRMVWNSPDCYRC